MHMLRKLEPSLFYLRKANYVEGPDDDLQLSRDGLDTIESIFRKFLTYLRKHQSQDDLSYWVRTLSPYTNEIWKLMENIYFHVEKDPFLGSAFGRYLNEIGSLRNAITFEVKEQDLGTLVDDIFINLDKVNKQFQHKFGYKLFSPPVAACAYMSKAVRAHEPDITNLVAVIGTILNAICVKQIEKLSTAAKGNSGSITKFKAFLESSGIGYDAKTIETLKNLYGVRSRTYPLHETGTKEIEYLKRLDIPIDADNYGKALKILDFLNNCLIEMKKWFG
jgi:hypothetical protein